MQNSKVKFDLLFSTFYLNSEVLEKSTFFRFENLKVSHLLRKFRSETGFIRHKIVRSGLMNNLPSSTKSGMPEKLTFFRLGNLKIIHYPPCWNFRKTLGSFDAQLLDKVCSTIFCSWSNLEVLEKIIFYPLKVNNLKTSPF